MTSLKITSIVIARIEKIAKSIYNGCMCEHCVNARGTANAFDEIG